MAHPRVRLVDRVDVFARVLGISSNEVEQATDDGTLRDLLADVTIGELGEAYEEASNEAIEAAVAAGTIDPDQAERLRELAPGAAPFGRFGFDRADFEQLRELRGVVEVDVNAVYAAVLGLTAQELDQARADGSLRDLLADADRVALAAALVDATDAAIDEALAAGEISAEQAELLRDSGLGFGRGGFGGFKRGFGGHGSGSHGRPSAAPLSTGGSA